MTLTARLFIIALGDSGLQADVAVLKRAVGHHFDAVVLPVIRPYRAWKLPKTFDVELAEKPGKDDVVVFLEHMFPLRDVFRSPCRKVFIPNMEQLSRSDVSLSHTVCDEVLHKCPDSQRVYELMAMGLPPGPAHHIIGWTSPSRRPAPSACPTMEWTKCLHVMGKSPMKGTTALVNVWRRHPEWPVLTIVGVRELLPGELPSNIEFLNGISDAWLEQLMARSGIHICPSQAEGWGHTICEGLSVGAHVITTDAPPMSNILGTSTGALVRPLARLPFGSTVRTTYPDLPWEANDFAYWNEPDAAALEAAIQRALTTTTEVGDISANSYARFRQLRRAFEITMHGWLRRMGVDVGDTILPPLSEITPVAPAEPQPEPKPEPEPEPKPEPEPEPKPEPVVEGEFGTFHHRVSVGEKYADSVDPQGRHPCWNWVIAAANDYRRMINAPLRVPDDHFHYLDVAAPDRAPQNNTKSHIQMRGDQLVGLFFTARDMVLFLDAMYRIRQLSHHANGVGVAAKLVAEQWKTDIFQV